MRLAREWLASYDKPPMTLSTFGPDGYPDARTVLLSGVDGGSVQFHTDARSRKAAQLAADPRASAVVLLNGRQIVLVGDVEPLDAPHGAYGLRTRYLQVLAWVNTDELAARPPDVRREAWKRFEEEHPDALEPPPTWAGYRLRPRRMTFWTADDAGPSTRVEYVRHGAGWTARALAG
ncbi:pyridoxamine-phosphate oxidase [Cryptosporangium arvum DSM 44712]|uniref:Pyridoxamine-phosphate oxidase n=2 Tax=Cryptosporangium TaxID=65502 RepID=A0A010YIG9_9ACTN|nr:pyridoxamine-phosphate oxidase [Cryptosporangium arvum DSM 44712]